MPGAVEESKTMIVHPHTVGVSIRGFENILFVLDPRRYVYEVRDKTRYMAFNNSCVATKNIFVPYINLISLRDNCNNTENKSLFYSRNWKPPEPSGNTLRSRRKPVKMNDIRQSVGNRLFSGSGKVYAKNPLLPFPTASTSLTKVSSSSVTHS